MNAIQESFTDKLFANYEANVNTKRLKTLLATMEFCSSRTSPEPCRQCTCFLIDLTKDR